MQVRTEFATINKGGWAEDGEEEKDFLDFLDSKVTSVTQNWRRLLCKKPVKACS